MTRDLSPEAVAARLALLSRLYVPMTLEEALAMQGRGWEGDLDEIRTLSKHLRDPS